MEYNYKVYTDDITIYKQYKEVKICFVISGKINVIKGNDTLNYVKGNIFILKPYDPIMILKISGGLIILNVNLLTFNRFSLHNINQTENKINSSLEVDELLKKHFLEAMLQIYKQKWFDADISIIRLINYIRIYNYYNPDDIKVTNPLIKSVLNYINENHDKELNLNTLSSHFHANPSYLSRLFSSEVNITLIRYIRKVKIYKTALKILKTNSVKNSWHYSGYKKYSTFLKHFKSVFNVSPDEFLRKRKDVFRKDIESIESMELERFYKELEERYNNS